MQALGDDSTSARPSIYLSINPGPAGSCHQPGARLGRPVRNGCRGARGQGGGGGKKKEKEASRPPGPRGSFVCVPPTQGRSEEEPRKSARLGEAGVSLLCVFFFSSPTHSPSGAPQPNTPRNPRPGRPWVHRSEAAPRKSRATARSCPGASVRGPDGRPGPAGLGPPGLTCQQFLQTLAEGLQLPLAREPLGAEELGDEGHGRSDLADHGGSPAVEGMHGGGGRGWPGAAGARRRAPRRRSWPPRASLSRRLRGPEERRTRRRREDVDAKGARMVTLGLFFFGLVCFPFFRVKKKSSLPDPEKRQRRAMC